MSMLSSDGHLLFGNKIGKPSNLSRQRSARTRKSTPSPSPARYKYDETNASVGDIKLQHQQEINSTLPLSNNDVSHSQLMTAVHYGKLDEVKKLLQKVEEKEAKRLVNRISKYFGVAALHIAVRYGDFKFAQFLIQKGADINLKGDEEKQPIHFAAKFYKDFPSNPSTNHYNDLTTDDVTSSRKNCLHLLIRHGADVNARDVFQSTPLHYACQKGHVKAVKILLESNNIQLNVLNEQLSSPIHEAASSGHFATVELLLSLGTSVRRQIDSFDRNKSTPLHLACRDGHLKVAELFLKVTYVQHDVIKRMLNRDVDGNTPLHVAVESGSTDTVEYLLNTWKNALTQLRKKSSEVLNSGDEYIDLKTGDGFTPLHLAAEVGSVAMLKVLFERNPFPNATNQQSITPLHLTAKRGYLESLEFLLSRGCNTEIPDLNQLSPLLSACKNGDVAVLKKLIQYKANIRATDIQMRNCLFLAVRSGSIETVQFLVSSSEYKDLLYERDRFGNTVLHESASQGNLTIFKMLLNCGLSVSSRNDAEQTTLHIASLKGKNNIIREIVNKSRWSVNDQDEHSRTALHLAASKGNLQTVDELINLGAATGDIDVNGMTPLQTCIVNGWLECAEIVLEADPSVINHTTRRKETALHLACMKGDECMVKLLQKYNPDVTACLDDGRNAMDLAIDCSHKNCVIALIDNNSWMKSMKNASYMPKSKIPTTPMRKLIQYMPESAYYILNKCISHVDENFYEKNHEIKLNFELLEDEFTLSSWLNNNQNETSKKRKKSRKSIRRRKSNLQEMSSFLSINQDGRETRNSLMETKNDHQVDIKSNKKEFISYSDDSYAVALNHPLYIMANASCENLLRHPLVRRLLLYKWKKYGLAIYCLNLLAYILFLGFFTLFMYRTPPKFAFNEEHINSQNFSSGNYCVRVVSEAVPYWGGDCRIKEVDYIISTVMVISFSIIQLIRKLKQLYHLKKKFFLDLYNYFEISLYVLSILVVLDLNEISEKTGIKSEWQWECGAFALLFAWINFSSFLRLTPFGIYILMVGSVIKSFLEFFPVMFIFLIGFASSFYVLLQNQLAFVIPTTSFINTLVMTMGEFEFTETFIVESDEMKYRERIFYKNSSLVIFVIFVFVLSLLVTNLLVGIAVDDIALVYDQAALKQLAIHVGSFLTIEYMLPKIFRQRIQTHFDIVKPNVKKKNFFINVAFKNFDSDGADLIGKTISEKTEKESFYEEMHEIKASLKRLSSKVDKILEKE